MAKYAKITLDVRRYNQHGEKINQVQFSATVAPEIIVHKNIVATDPYVLGLQEKENTEDVFYFVALNWSFVDVTVVLSIVTDSGTAEATLTLPAASDSNSPGLLIVPHVSLSTNNEVTLTPSSGTAKCELFMFAAKLPG